MRVLLISPNKESVPDPVFPLGLAYVASGLLREGHDVRILDLLFSEDIQRDIEHAVGDFQPEIVGLSLRNIDDVAYPHYHSYINEYKEVVSILKDCTEAPLVLGGSGFTIMPKEFMKELKADYGIVGEGEEAFPLLIKNLGCERRLWEARRLRSIDGFEPATWLFNTDAYYQAGGMLNVQTKRGCSFKCIYCTYPMVEGRRIRTMDPRAVVDGIERMTDTIGARHFFIVDSVFNNPPEHAAEICREIVRRKVKINWTCYCSPSRMDERLVDLMVKSGCAGVEFGTDSLLDQGLEALGKNFRYQNVKEVSACCRHGGLKFCHFLFLGAPGDTTGSVFENLERLESISPDAAVIMAGIRIFPHTRLDSFLRHDHSYPEPRLEPSYFIEPDILENLEHLVREVKRRRNWIMPGFEVNMNPRVMKMLRKSGVKGPLWGRLSSTPMKRKVRVRDEGS